MIFQTRSSFTRFLYFLIYQEKLCLFFNNFFP
ncbi:hypothetical protein [Blautia wexlerae]